eukprot:TRINITY_DN1187_c0_g1_i1.p1 TRINITY_DN1187_c0_g1~~TRINITY_DN1187_c0_g1_i1.p1  ORF type:complete len:260 (-),score=29.43 TRINITY_DN1187_c0_g1_i1:108-836(-)
MKTTKKGKENPPYPVISKPVSFFSQENIYPTGFSSIFEIPVPLTIKLLWFASGILSILSFYLYFSFSQIFLFFQVISLILLYLDLLIILPNVEYEVQLDIFNLVTYPSLPDIIVFTLFSISAIFSPIEWGITILIVSSSIVHWFLHLGGLYSCNERPMLSFMILLAVIRLIYPLCVFQYHYNLVFCCMVTAMSVIGSPHAVSMLYRFRAQRIQRILPNGSLYSEKHIETDFSMFFPFLYMYQ